MFGTPCGFGIVGGKRIWQSGTIKYGSCYLIGADGIVHRYINEMSDVSLLVPGKEIPYRDRLLPIRTD